MTELLTRKSVQDRIDKAIEQLQGAHILVVEDNDLNQELVLDLLHNHGISAQVAHNGQEALDILADQTFDGILMDCQMPTMDGYTATRKLRTYPHLKDLPVIAMTANAMVSDRIQALDSGMNDHIAKPINVDNMFITMAKWITPAQQTSRQTADNTETPEAKGIPLPALAGINTQTALAQLHGRMRLYLKLLIGFRDRYKDFETIFRAAQKDSDPVAATRTVHTLAGLAANIGATHINQLAKELEFSCENSSDTSSNDIEQKLSQLITALQPVIKNMDVLDEHQEYYVLSAQAIDKNTLEPLLNELNSLIRANNIKAGQIVKQLTPLLDEENFTGHLQNILDALDEFDFETAQDKFSQLVDELEITI